MDPQEGEGVEEEGAGQHYNQMAEEVGHRVLLRRKKDAI